MMSRVRGVLICLLFLPGILPGGCHDLGSVNRPCEQCRDAGAPDADMALPDAAPADQALQDQKISPEGLPPDSGPPKPPPGVCNARGWCWMNPVPQGEHLHALTGAGPTEIYAVGEQATVLRFDGAAWKKYPAGITANPRGVWGWGKGKVVMVGEGGTIIQKK